MLTFRPVQHEPQQETLEHPGNDDNVVVTVDADEDGDEDDELLSMPPTGTRLQRKRILRTMPRKSQRDHHRGKENLIERRNPTIEMISGRRLWQCLGSTPCEAPQEALLPDYEQNGTAGRLEQIGIVKNHYEAVRRW